MIKSAQNQLVFNVISSTAVSLSLLGINHSVLAQPSELASCLDNCKQQLSNTFDTAASAKNQSKSLTNFTDISGVYGETAIQQLEQLGVFTTTSTEFQPLAPITRGEFVAWLVKTYNKLHKDPIRPSSSTTPAFPDVPASHPYFTYIQSAYNAGFLAGFADGNFRPDDILTREQMIVLKSPLDSSGRDSRPPNTLRNFISRTRGFTDADQITEQYLSYIAFDLGNAASGRNFARVYGRTRIYAPQKAVTRAEASVLLSRFRKGGTVEQALQRRSR